MLLINIWAHSERGQNKKTCQKECTQAAHGHMSPRQYATARRGSGQKSPRARARGRRGRGHRCTASRGRKSSGKSSSSSRPGSGGWARATSSNWLLQQPARGAARAEAWGQGAGKNSTALGRPRRACGSWGAACGVHSPARRGENPGRDSDRRRRLPPGRSAGAGSRSRSYARRVPCLTVLVARMRAAGPLTSCPVSGGQSLQPTQPPPARLLLFCVPYLATRAGARPQFTSARVAVPSASCATMPCAPPRCDSSPGLAGYYLGWEGECGAYAFSSDHDAAVARRESWTTSRFYCLGLRGPRNVAASRKAAVGYRTEMISN